MKGKLYVYIVTSKLLLILEHMKERPSLKEILGDFNPSVSAQPDSRARHAVTIWLSPEDKARYDRLQEMSRREFSKKAREALRALITLAEDRTASPT